MATILAWSGCATSAKMVSTMGTCNGIWVTDLQLQLYTLINILGANGNVMISSVLEVFGGKFKTLTSILYLWGCLASSMIGTTFMRFLAMLMRSRPERCENSTAYTMPSWKWCILLYKKCNKVAKMHFNETQNVEEF